MNAKQFLVLMNKGNALEKEDFQALVKLHEIFPYFVIPKILAARYASESGDRASQEFLHWAAVQSPDRLRLKQLIEQEMDFLPPPFHRGEVPEAGTTGSEAEIQPAKEPSIDDTNLKTRAEILKRLEENLIRFKKSPDRQDEAAASSSEVDAADEDLIASIKKKEKKAILDSRKKKQNDLINAFSKKSVKLTSIEENQHAAEMGDLSKNSTTFNDKLISEAFAKLLIKQNKKEQAVEIYKKLMLKFPNKTAYFASLIERLEE